MAITKTNILGGIGDVYIATQGAALPGAIDTTTTTVASTDWTGSTWSGFGAKATGIELTYEPEFHDTIVQDVTGTIKKRLVGEKATVKFDLAEVAAANFAYAIAGLGSTSKTVTVGQTGQTITKVGNYTATEFSLAIQGTAPGTGVHRIYHFNTVVPTGSQSIMQSKEDNQKFTIELDVLAANAASTSNPVYAAGELFRVIDITAVATTG